MRGSLRAKLSFINLLAVGLVLAIVYAAVEYYAADYFMTLMKLYDISPTDAHKLFLQAMYLALGGAALVSLVGVLLLSYWLTVRVLRPLEQMNAQAERIARGELQGDVQIRAGDERRDEVAQLAGTFNRMAAALRRAESLRRKMVTDVSHELRTPLTNMRGYLEALKDGVIPASGPNLESLHEECLRLGALVEDLVALTRSEAVRHSLAHQPTSLGTLVRDTLQNFAHRFEEKNLIVKTRNLHAASTVSLDRRRITQVIQNLLDNALRYTPAGESLTVDVQSDDRQVVVRFSNTGVEVEAAVLPFIFERFVRGDASRSREHGGVGIGLAIVKELVEAHGGTVGAYSAANQTCVWFALPRLGAVADAAIAPGPKSATPATPGIAVASAHDASPPVGTPEGLSRVPVES